MRACAACTHCLLAPGCTQAVTLGAAQVARGIEATVNLLVKELEKMSTDVTDDDLANVATVSAGNNEVVRRRCCLQGCCLRLAVGPGAMVQHSLAASVLLIMCQGPPCPAPICLRMHCCRLSPVSNAPQSGQVVSQPKLCARGTRVCGAGPLRAHELRPCACWPADRCNS